MQGMKLGLESLLELFDTYPIDVVIREPQPNDRPIESVETSGNADYVAAKCS